MTGRCTATTTVSLVKVEENGRKVIFYNKANSKYHVTKIDGCLITEGKRCDYLVSKSGVASVFVELKGSDLNHACEQLIATASHPSVSGLLENKISFMLICSRFPRMDTSVQRAKSKVARLYSAGLHICCDQRKVDIEALLKF